MTPQPNEIWYIEYVQTKFNHLKYPKRWNEDVIGTCRIIGSLDENRYLIKIESNLGSILTVDRKHLLRKKTKEPGWIQRLLGFK